MKFMTLVKSSEKNGPPPQALMDAMEQLGKDANASGQMVLSGGLYGSGYGGIRVRLDKGKISMTDGPFTETKEVIGGFAVLQFDTREEAVEACKSFMELHKKHWPGWEGESEMRQIYDDPTEVRSKGK